MLSSLPTFLIPALPFALVTSTLHFVPSVTLRSTPVPPSAGMTKYYYKPHIDRLKRKFEDVKSLGPAAVEEWIKGLESKGKEHLADSARWEQWEVNGGLRAVQEGGSLIGTRPRSPAKSDSAGPSSAASRRSVSSNGKWTSSEQGPVVSASRYGTYRCFFNISTTVTRKNTFAESASQAQHYHLDLLVRKSNMATISSHAWNGVGEI